MANEAPPVLAAYQSIVPALVVAESITGPGPQRLLELAAVIVGMVLMVATTAVLELEAQPL